MSDVELDLDERRSIRAKAHAALLDALRAAGGEAPRHDLLTAALAGGEFTARERRAPSPDPSYPGFVERQLSFTLSDLKRSGLVENPRRGVWRLAGAALDPAPAPLAPVEDEARLAELRAMPYREYLRTPEWRRARAAALERAGNACSLDVAHTGRLEVHHNTYERRGAELPGDLVVLCQACHRLHHAAHGRPRKGGARAKAAPARRPSLLRRLLAG